MNEQTPPEGMDPTQAPLAEATQSPPPVPNIDEHPSFNPDAETEVELDDNEPKPAISIHVVFMEDGQFAIQAQGEPNLGEMQMLLSRALSSVEARMVGETVAQVMATNQQKSRIITPGR